MIKYVFFIFGIILAAMFYTLANFHDRIKNKGMLYAIIIALIFATFEYSIKIPLWYYVRDIISPLVIQISWVTTITILVMLFQIYFLKDHPHPISILLGFISILLLIVIIIIEHHK